jgi:hypothetical protein
MDLDQPASATAFPLFGLGYRRILDLGVYRCSEEQYLSEQRADSAAAVPSYMDPRAEKRQIEDIKALWSDRYGGAWLGNEVVGLISICAAHAKLGGVLYYVRDRRITKRMARKRLFLLGKMFEFNTLFWQLRTSPEIYEKLRQELSASIAGSATLKRRVVDFEPLDALGPHINWVAITSDAPPREHSRSQPSSS